MREVSRIERVDLSQEAAEQLIFDLILMIAEGALENQLLAHIQANAVQVFGKELTETEARDKLAPVLMIAEVRGIRPQKQKESPSKEGQLSRVKRSCFDEVRFLFGGITLFLRLEVIHTCPGIVDFLAGKYTSSIDSKKLSISDVLNTLGGMENLASAVVHYIERIRLLRIETGKDILLQDAEMEFLRRVLFLVNKMRIRDSMFCDFGQGILRDLRTYVGDYEKTKNL